MKLNLIRRLPRRRSPTACSVSLLFRLGLKGRRCEHLADDTVALDGVNAGNNLGYLLGLLVRHPLQWLYGLGIAFGVGLFDTLNLCEMLLSKCRDKLRRVIVKACANPTLIGRVKTIASDALRALDKRGHRYTEYQEEDRRNGNKCQRPEEISHCNMDESSISLPNVLA